MDGSGDRLYFTLSDEEFAQLKSGDPVWVGYGGDRVADLGRLDKSLFVDRNRITAVRRLTASDQLPGRARIEIELSSEEPCCTGKGAPRLSVGYQRYSLSHNAGSAPHRLTFTLTPKEFAQLKSGAPVYLWWKPDEARYFGRLDKGMLDKNK
jgi:hypothetical protein